jgi:hypothetical protein
VKYFLLILVINLFLLSCSLAGNYSIPDFNSLDEANKWIWKNIEYESDDENYGYTEFWAKPEQVLERKRGDCEDMAILLLYIAKTQFNYEGKLVSISLRDYKNFHAITSISSQYYDPCWNYIGWNGGYGIGQKTYDYYTVMAMASSNYKW